MVQSGAARRVQKQTSKPEPETQSFNHVVTEYHFCWHLATLDLLWCENQQEGEVGQDVGDGDNSQTQDHRPGVQNEH